MEPTVVAAWWGAIIGSLVLLWDIYKWLKSGPILRITALPNMNYLGPEGEGYSKENTYIFVEATNVGNRKTTLTNLCGYYHENLFKKITKQKPKYSFVVATPLSNQRIPYPLAPGEIWTGSILQNEDVEKMVNEGFFYVGLAHSSSSKPVYKRVKKKK